MMASVTLPPISPSGSLPNNNGAPPQRHESSKSAIKSASSSSSGGSPQHTLSQRGLQLQEILDDSGVYQPLQQQQQKSHRPPVRWAAPDVSKGAPPVGTPLLRKKDRQMLAKKETLREAQPTLTKLDTAKYRNSYKHNLCLEMLQEGLHKSFAEIMNLMKRQQESRAQAGPDSALWMQPLLEDEPGKLDQLRAYLTQAEFAQRRGLKEEVYAAQFELACFFQSGDDRWLADHFFEASLNTAKSMTGDNDKKMAEAHRNLGLSLEQGENNVVAMEHLESFYDLCKEKPWSDRDGVPYVKSACKHLCRLYSTIGTDIIYKQKDEDKGDPYEQAIVYFVKAHEMACQSGDRETEGAASYKLGLAHERLDEPDVAMGFLTSYLHVSQATDDETGVGQALEALARCCESLGQMEETIDYLKRFAELALRTKQEAAYSRACSLLSTVYNSLGRRQSMGDLEQSEEHFSRAYNTAKTRNDNVAIQAARAQYGVSCGQKLMENFVQALGMSDLRKEVGMLVEWKNDRYVEKKISEDLAEGNTPSISVKIKDQDHAFDVEGNEFDDFMADWSTHDDLLFDGEGILKHLININFAPFRADEGKK